MLLEQLLETVDFAGAVDSLASDFREKHGLGRIDQLGLVVPSVEDAAARLETLGIGPFLISSGAPVRWEERGEPRRFKGKLGLARHNMLTWNCSNRVKGRSFTGNIWTLAVASLFSTWVSS